jgi:N-acetylmuramoyl-L-alanine amidase
VRTIAARMQAAVDAGHGDDDMAATVEAGRG